MGHARASSDQPRARPRATGEELSEISIRGHRCLPRRRTVELPESGREYGRRPRALSTLPLNVPRPKSSGFRHDHLTSVQAHAPPAALPRPDRSRCARRRAQVSKVCDLPVHALAQCRGGTSLTQSPDRPAAGPRALAVRRLTTSSNLEDCSMGRSAGLAPLRTLSMYPEPLRIGRGAVLRAPSLETRRTWVSPGSSA
jgi:hypothetical protein